MYLLTEVLEEAEMWRKGKLYKCKVEGCNNRQPILSKGMCNYHREMSRKSKTKTKADFFKTMVERHSKYPYSMESGAYISGLDAKNICHIFPKSKFPSVAEDERNIIVLTWQEHTDFDNLLFENRFDELEEKFPMISQALKFRLPELLERVTERNKFYYNIESWMYDE